MTLLRNRTVRILLTGLALALLAAPEAGSQPRSGGRTAPPPAAPSGAQTEAVDLNEGKSAAELFQGGCAVCHQSPGGLAKGRGAGELILPWVLAVGRGMGVGAMAGVVAPYPTLGEVSKRAAGAYYAPKLFGAGTRRVVRLLQRLG